MAKKLCLLGFMLLVSGCESSGGYRPPPSAQQQALDMQMINLGAQIMNQSRAAPPPPPRPQNCTSTVFGNQIQTTCY